MIATTFCVTLAVTLTVEARVQQLVGKMDNPNWQVREQAVRDAGALGRAAVPYLVKASRTHASQEVRKGCGRAIKLCRRSPGYTVLPDLYPQFQKYPQIKFLATKYERLLGEIDDEEKEFRKEVAKAKVVDLRQVEMSLAGIQHRREKGQKMLLAVHKGIWKSLDETRKVMPSRNHTDIELQRHATSLYVRDLLKAGMPREEVIDLLNELVEIEEPGLKSAPVKK